MTPEEAERVVLNESKRQDDAAILREAKQIVREQRKAAIAKRGEAIQVAELAVELARARIEQRTDAKLSTRLGSGPTDTDVERFLAAKSHLAELEQTPLPDVGEPVLIEDQGPRPTMLCETDKVEMRGNGTCPVCGGRKTHQPIRPALDRLKPFLARGHGIA